MELVLIPPLTRLADTLDQQTHLVLPHLLRDAIYAEYLEEVAESDSDYVILDNGLAEGQQVVGAALIIIAAHHAVDELVVPDVLGDREASIACAVDFVRTLRRMQDDHPLGASLAFVAQGRNVDDTFRCAQDYLEHPELQKYVNTIMIPRRLVTSKEPHARLEVADRLYNWLSATEDEVDIHLLGGSRFFPQEIAVAAKDHPFIRSMDTSLPYVYAWNNVRVNDIVLHPPEHRNDNQNYWELEFERGPQASILQYNIATMRRWAEG